MSRTNRKSRKIQDRHEIRRFSDGFKDDLGGYATYADREIETDELLLDNVIYITDWRRRHQV